MTRKEMMNIVKELKEQDKILAEIFETRQNIAKECKEKNIYDEIWDMLYSDKKEHFNF